MANRIQIRHGTNAPQDGELLPYELGWGGDALYIGEQTGGQNTISPINITGNAATATNATNDENGNNISNTYLSLSGSTLQVPSLKLGGHATTVGTVLKASLSAQKAISSEVITNITSLELPSGTWVVTGRVRFSANSTGYRRAGFGTTDSEGAIQVQTPAVTGAVTQLTLTKIIEVSSNTTYYLNAYQNSGSSLNLAAGNNGEINGITAICIA